MNNCFDCKHKRTAFSDLSDVEGMEQISGTWFGRCASGNTANLVHFLGENGKKHRSEVTGTVPCFEATAFDKAIDRALELTNQLLTEAKQKE